MTTDTDLNQTFEKIRERVVAPDVSTIAHEAQRRSRQRHVAARSTAVFCLAVFTVAGSLAYLNRAEVTEVATTQQPADGPADNPGADTNDEATSTTLEPDAAQEPDITTTTTEPDAAQEPDITTTTTEPDAEQEPDITTTTSGPLSATAPGGTLSGQWVAQTLLIDGVSVALPEQTPTLSIRGRSVSGTDGCNTWSGRTLWDQLGFISIVVQDSTSLGCPADAANADFNLALQNANTWGFTESGLLTLTGDGSSLELEAGLPLDVLPVEGQWTLIGVFEEDVNGLSELTEDDPVVHLTVDATGNAVLETDSCAEAFRIDRSLDNTTESPIVVSELDPTSCGTTGLARDALIALERSDYALSATQDNGGPLLLLWDGAQTSVGFRR